MRPDTRLPAHAAAVMLYAPGSIMYLYHRKKTGQKYFNNTTDLLIFIGVLIALVVAVYMTATGGIVLL